jgi:hypothetical protein
MLKLGDGRVVGVDAEDEEPLRGGQGLRHQDPGHAG